MASGQNSYKLAKGVRVDQETGRNLVVKAITTCKLQPPFVPVVGHHQKACPSNPHTGIKWHYGGLTSSTYLGHRRNTTHFLSHSTEITQSTQITVMPGCLIHKPYTEFNQRAIYSICNIRSLL